MHKLKLTQLLLYRWRYSIGYGLVGLVLAGVIVLAAFQAPGGISAAERTAAITSSSLDLQQLATFSVSNLPFHLLQRLGFEIFGMSDLTIKLPSIIIAVLSAAGLVLLLRKWFRPNIAVLASLIAITTGQFIFVAQSGTASILYIFWPTLILLLGTQTIRSERFRSLWTLLLGIAIGLSVYTPLSIYMLLATSITILLHPHLRMMLRKLPRLPLLISAAAIALSTSLLAYLVILDASFGLRLLGIFPTTGFTILENLQTLAYTYFGFWLSTSSVFMTPVFGLGSMVLAAIGLYQIVRHYHTSQGHLLLAWLLLLIPVQIIEPRFTTVTFVAIVLLVATGLGSLISYWYRLFPRNPYARVAGLVPLIVLVGTLMGSGLDRYFYGYRYDQSVAGQFSQDLRLLPKDTKQLVVSEDEYTFYAAVGKYRPQLDVVTTPSNDRFIASRSATVSAEEYAVERIITSPQSTDGDRFYIYKK